jgi:hypothetical protein
MPYKIPINIFNPQRSSSNPIKSHQIPLWIPALKPGLFAACNALIPPWGIAPIILFVGLAINQDAFNVVESRHIPVFWRRNSEGFWGSSLDFLWESHLESVEKGSWQVVKLIFLETKRAWTMTNGYKSLVFRPMFGPPTTKAAIVGLFPQTADWILSIWPGAPESKPGTARWQWVTSLKRGTLGYPGVPWWPKIAWIFMDAHFQLFFCCLEWF